MIFFCSCSTWPRCRAEGLCLICFCQALGGMWPELGFSLCTRTARATRIMSCMWGSQTRSHGCITVMGPWAELPDEHRMLVRNGGAAAGRDFGSRCAGPRVGRAQGHAGTHGFGPERSHRPWRGAAASGAGRGQRRAVGLGRVHGRGVLQPALFHHARLRAGRVSPIRSPPGNDCCIPTIWSGARRLPSSMCARAWISAWNSVCAPRTAAGDGYWPAARWCAGTASGNVARVIGTHVDITERKDMEARLVESEAKLPRAY